MRYCNGQIEKMDAAAEEVGLIAGFAVEGDDAAVLDRSLAGPYFLDDSDAVVGNGSDAEENVDKNDRGDSVDEPPDGGW